MATKKKSSTSQNKSSAKHRVITGEVPASVVSLSDEDREYLSGGMKNARSRFGNDAGDESAVFEMLEKFGMGSDRVAKLRQAMAKLNPSDAVEKAGEYFAEQIENARDYSRENRGKVLGGAAGVLVGASLLAMALNRASEGSSSGTRRSTSARSTRARSTGGSRKSTAKRGGRSATGSKKASSKRSSASSSTGGTSTRKASKAGASRKSAAGSRKSSGGSTSKSSGSSTRKSSSRKSSTRKSSTRKSSARKSTGGRGTARKSSSRGSARRTAS